MTQYDISLWQKALAEKNKLREENRRATLLKVREILGIYFSGRNISSLYLCGSLLCPDAFDDRSDVDIAVSGLSEDSLRVAAELEELIGREVDLIELENCRFRTEIEQKGLRVL